MRFNAGSAVSIALFAVTVLAPGCGPTTSSGGGGDPGIPTSVAISSGDNQSAVVSTLLPRFPVVLVSDAEGRAVAGVPVSFTIVDGGGTVSPASSTTDASGLASTGWTLGPTPGLNHLRASAAGVTATVTFAATGTAPVGVPASISKKTGDSQTAVPGSAVALAPVVIVKDAFGTAVAGASVIFAVTFGGGAIQVASARTDAVGQASCGTWTLGATVGVNTMTATVPGVAPATFYASAASTSPDVKVTVPSPTAGKTVGEAMAVVATVTSTYQLASVTASAGGTTIPMTLGVQPCSNPLACPAWLGTISLAGQPRGPVSLVVTARDVLGNTTNVAVPVVFDKAPTVLVSAPLDGAVARPNTNIVATCTDDDPAGCKSLTATVEWNVVATGTGSISQSVDLSASEGSGVTVIVTGEDSIGQRVAVSRTVYVESSTHLAVKAEVSGAVWDASGARVLYLDTSGATPSLEVTDTATGTTQVLETGADLGGTWGGYGFLTPTGAIYAHGKAPSVYPYCWLFEWRSGALDDLGGINSCRSLEVAGAYAIFNEAGAGAGTTTLMRRDLATGTNVTISNAAGNTANGVASNGDVAYWTSGTEGYNIHRWRDGASQALTSDPYATLWNTYPVTDGVHVVYRKHTPCCGEQTYRIAMHDGSTETILSSASTVQPSPGTGYAVAGGHVAYTSEDMAKSLQVWRRSPSGEEQLTIFGSSSTINAIAPDGTVVLAHTGRRFRATPGVALQDIGSTLGRVVVRDGKFLILLGRTVMEVLP